MRFDTPQLFTAIGALEEVLKAQCRQFVIGSVIGNRHLDDSEPLQEGQQLTYPLPGPGGFHGWAQPVPLKPAGLKCPAIPREFFQTASLAPAEGFNDQG